MLVYGYYVFFKPSVQGFPIAFDPADRSCRYLVQPPTVPIMARLRGYQRPPRGGRDRCRWACERTPLWGRRRCAAGGRLRKPKPLGTEMKTECDCATGFMVYMEVQEGKNAMREKIYAA
jgi:hypothetical protein